MVGDEQIFGVRAVPFGFRKCFGKVATDIMDGPS